VSRSVASLHEAARAAIPPFHVMDVWAAAGERQRTHGDLINLSAGQPSTPAPRPVRTAAAAALERDVLGYTVALGLPELRAGVAAHYGHTYGLPVTVDDAITTTARRRGTSRRWRCWRSSGASTA
jgi:aspartate/methionine/tyrosine aminotransferase